MINKFKNNTYIIIIIFVLCALLPKWLFSLTLISLNDIFDPSSLTLKNPKTLMMLNIIIAYHKMMGLLLFLLSLTFIYIFVDFFSNYFFNCEKSLVTFDSDKIFFFSILVLIPLLFLLNFFFPSYQNTFCLETIPEQLEDTHILVHTGTDVRKLYLFYESLAEDEVSMNTRVTETINFILKYPGLSKLPPDYFDPNAFTNLGNSLRLSFNKVTTANKIDSMADLLNSLYLSLDVKKKFILCEIPIERYTHIVDISDKLATTLEELAVKPSILLNPNFWVDVKLTQPEAGSYGAPSAAYILPNEVTNKLGVHDNLYEIYSDMIVSKLNKRCAFSRLYDVNGLGKPGGDPPQELLVRVLSRNYEVYFDRLANELYELNDLYKVRALSERWTTDELNEWVSEVAEEKLQIIKKTFPARLASVTVPYIDGVFGYPNIFEISEQIEPVLIKAFERANGEPREVTPGGAFFTVEGITESGNRILIGKSEKINSRYDAYKMGLLGQYVKGFLKLFRSEMEGKILNGMLTSAQIEGIEFNMVRRRGPRGFGELVKDWVIREITKIP